MLLLDDFICFLKYLKLTYAFLISILRAIYIFHSGCPELHFRGSELLLINAYFKRDICYTLMRKQNLNIK